jgi:hypothetical protein
MHIRRLNYSFCVAVILLCFAGQVVGQMVQLPFVMRDDFNSNWDIQYDGSIGDGGNDLYDGGGRLFLNNQFQYQSPNGQATLDATRNEVTLAAMQMMGLNVSRKICVLPRLGLIRFTEVFENPTANAIRVQARIYFNMGGSVQQAVPLVDPKRKEPIGFAIGDGNNAAAMIAAGRGSKILPRFQYQQNNDNVDIFFDVEVPAKKTVAIVHAQLRRPTAGQCAEAWAGLKDKTLLADVPKELRRKIVNFPGGDLFIGELEILRGEALDIVELRGGDSYRGDLKVKQFNLATLYGPVQIPVEKVLGLINTGTYRPVSLVVTVDGDVFSGRLDIDRIPLQLTSGQMTMIPLAGVTRIGYRRRAGEPEEWNYERPTAFMRSGERVRIRLPGNDLNLATPSGPIRLSPTFISSIAFEGEENTVPIVHLVDGSKISALLGASSFEMSVVGLGSEQSVRMPSAALTRFYFAPEAETDHLSPSLTLANGDALVGTIGGTLSLMTPNDTLHIEGPQIKKLVQGSAGGNEVQITLWDDSTISGRLSDAHLSCTLRCGLAVSIPVALVEQYVQPMPIPSKPMVERIRQIARDLDNEDWRLRDRAQRQIMTIGPSVMSVLRQIQPSAPPEASQRIELMLHRLARELENPGNGVGMPDGDAMGQVEVFDRVEPMIILDR